MTDPDGGEWVEVYENNLLVERRDPLGNSLKYGYDDKLNRISVIDANNKETRFTFDAEGNMLTRTASATLSYQEVWTYTAFSTVDSYTNGRGKVTDYDYDPSQRLVRITDPLNRATEFTHTAQGQIDTITDPRNKVTDFGYDADGNRTSVLSPEGNLTTFTFDGSGRMLSRTEPRGNVAGANPAEFTTEFTYNNADQPLTVTDALDRVTTYTYDDAGNLDTLTDADTKVTDVDYDADNQVTTVTDPRGAVTSTTYDDRGNLASVTTAASTPQAGKTMFVYDAANRVKHKITPRGNVTGADPAPFTWTYTYDANGNLETETNPTAGTIAYAYDELNRRTSTTDALTHETGFGYDANSNLTSVTDPLNRVTSYVFDDADQLDKVTDANGKVTDYDYDGSGNHTALTTPMGFQTRWTYDADGRLASQVDPRGTQTGAVPSEFTTTYAYDPAGHLTLVTDPLNHATTYAYDRVENLKTRTDANNHTTTYTYDVLDRLKTVTGPSNTGTTSYGYDAAGNLNTRTNAKNQVTTFDHDLAGRLKTKTTPIGTWTHTYDAAGNPKTTTTAAGNTTPADGNDATITRSYDPLDRLSGINYSDATPDVSYAYDQLRLASMTDAAGTETYDYDPAGQLQTVTRGGALFDYDYDTLGRINKRTHPDGTVVNQSWDDDSRPLALSSGAASATHQYDAAGNPIQASLGNGLTETRTYNRAGWLSDTVTKRPGNAIVAQHTMTRDNVGNPTQIVRRYDTLIITESYTYDPADRVTKACFGADCGERVEYTYDELGNRLTENRVDGIFSGLLTIGSGLVTSTYNDKNQLTQTTRPGALLQPPVVTNYGYDDNGNQTTQAPSTGGSTTYAYDLENRLKTATIGSATTSYAHDGNGLRRTATTGAATTSYTWDTNYPLPELAAETTSGATRQFLNNATGDPVAITNPGTGATTGLHYLHLDELGSVRTATDPAANVTNTYAYEPFGTSRYSPTSQNAITNPIGFAGEYKDPATGLYHLRARDYDTTTGRFTTLDPIAQDITDPYVAEYVYVKNRPTVFLDPSGLSEEVCTDGPWWQEVGEAICDTGEAIHSAITHPADTVAGAGHVGYQIQEFSVHGLLMKASGIDMSDFYDQAVADQFGVDVTGEAFAVGQVIGWEVCTLGVGGLVANGARASLRALAADRATGPARLGSLLFGIPGVGATSRLFGDIHSGAVRPGLLQGTSTLGLGWSGKRVVVDGKKRARTVFRGKYHGRKFDLWHGPWR
jgi:RHS repeat-associated protein